MHFREIYCCFFLFFLQWSLVRKYATSHYPNQLWPNLVIHICLTSELKDLSGKHGRYTSLDSKQTSQWNPVNMPTSQWFIHHLLCSFVHSHPITHLNYWNMCRLGCAIMLAATLSGTRYETISKHHVASNVNIITYIEEIVKYWGNWKSPRKKVNTVTTHDYVIKWKNYPRNWPFVPGIPRTNASDAEHWCFLWSGP